MSDGNRFLDWLFGPNIVARLRLNVRGTWVAGEALEGDPAPFPAVPRARYLRRVDPGAPLPAGIPPGAARYDMVCHNEMPRRLRLPATLAGAALTAGSVAAMAGGRPYGVIPLIVAVGLLAAGIHGGMETITFRRSDTGAWVEAEPEELAGKPSPMLSRSERAVYGALAVAALAVAIANIGGGNVVGTLIAGGLGVGLGAVTISGSRPVQRQDPGEAFRARMRFEELSDPNRPLTGEDLLLSSGSASGDTNRGAG